MHNAVAPSEQQRQPFVPQTNALFCFEFLIEAVDVLNLTTDLRIRQIDFKLDQYEWQSIEQEEWKNVGRRCYLLGEDHFLETLGNKKLRVRAIAHDDSVHSCDISLSSFHVQQGVAYCKGAMELFTSANSTRSVCVLTAMRIFNVDSVHPIPVHRSFLAIDRAVQTSDRHVEHKRVHARPAQRNAAIQTPLTKRRNVMIQVKERNALSNDVSVQCTARWYHEQVEKAVTEVVTRILASKGLVRAIRRRNHGADDHFAKQRNRSLAVVPRIRRPGANILNRRTSRWIPTSGSLSAAAIGFNVICRNQLIHTLDRIIAYKQKLSAQPMNAITTTQRSAQPMNAITTRQRPIVHRICRTANQTLNTDRTLRNSQRMRPKRAETFQKPHLGTSQKKNICKSRSNHSSRTPSLNSSANSNTAFSFGAHRKRSPSRSGSNVRSAQHSEASGSEKSSESSATSKSSPSSTVTLSSKLSSSFDEQNSHPLPSM